MERPVFKKSYSSSALLFALLIIPQLKTTFCNEFEFTDLTFNIARVISLIVTLVLILLRRQRPGLPTVFFAVFEIILLASTFFNGASLSMFIAKYVFGLVVYLIVDYFSDHPHVVVNTLFVIAEVLVYVNLITMVIFPDGLYVSQYYEFHHNWILGYKNQMGPYFICFTAVAFLRPFYEGKWTRSVILVLAMLASSLLSHSATIAAIMVILIVGALLALMGLRKLFNPYLLAGVVVALFMIIVLFNSAGVLSDVISAVTQRGTTFTGRTLIWQKSIDAIGQMPLFGWGVMTNESHISLLDHIHADNAHDFYLEIALSGGIVSLLIFGIFMFLILRNLRKYPTSYSAAIVSIALFALGVAWLFEAYVNPVLFVVFAIGANISHYAALEDESREIVIPLFSWIKTKFGNLGK